MRKLLIFSAVLSLFLLVPASITRAQTITFEKGLGTALFYTKYGRVKIYIPDDIRPGDRLSGTIVNEPDGRTAKQIARNRQELMKYTISAYGNKFPVPERSSQFEWIISLDRELKSPLELLHVSGFKAGELQLKFSAPAPSMPFSKDCYIPSHALTNSALTVKGNFDGRSSTTQVVLNHSELPVLAESPRQCSFYYSPGTGALQTLNINEKDKPGCIQEVRDVHLNVDAGKLNLIRGEKTFIHVNVTGLDRLRKPVILTLSNRTPAIVNLFPSNNIVISLNSDSLAGGTFDQHFDIESLLTGSFVVDVDLDVQGETTTTQPPPTEAQCPRCNCSCKASIIFEGKDKNFFSYRVEVAASCTGQFGMPPCKPCGIIDAYKYEWTISHSADKPIEIVGGNNSPGFSFKNPLNGAFTLTVKVTVTCADGSECTCTAETNYIPTISEPPTGRCKCSISCEIKKKQMGCDETEYTGIVDAKCVGFYVSGGARVPCSVKEIKYHWKIGTVGEGVAVIAGGADGKSVRVKLLKAGSFNIILTVTVICSDGSECVDGCVLHEVIPECIPDYEWCAGPPIKVVSYGYYPQGPQLYDMRPGDLIGLSVFGTDLDVLLQRCISPRGTSVTPHPPTPDQVTYLWSNEIKRRSSGELIFSGGIAANSLLYRLPYCVSDYPVEDHVIVTLGNAGHKKNDEEIEIEFTIKLYAIVDKIYTDAQKKKRELYKITASISAKVLNKPAAVSCSPIRGCCEPVLPADWTAGKPITVKEPIRFTFAPDSFPDNMILLKAEASDEDNVTLKCMGLGKKVIPRSFENIYDDPDYTWEVVSGNARFIQKKGQSVVLIHNYYGKDTRNNLVIECRINDSGKEGLDAGIPALVKDRDARKKPLALVGVGDFEFKPAGVPTGIEGDNGKKAAGIAATKYRNMGYGVIEDHDLTEAELKDAIKNPALQALFMIGHGAAGGMETSDKKFFSDFELNKWITQKWNCDKDPILHPFIRDLELLGCESGLGKWRGMFFRLEQYFAYGDTVYDCPVDEVSAIIDRANKFFPLKPRIAPPE